MEVGEDGAGELEGEEGDGEDEEEDECEVEEVQLHTGKESYGGEYSSA